MAAEERLREYNIVRLIGKGSYGDVYLVRAKREKKQFVMKNIMLASSKRKERDAAEQEASLLSQLNHPNIVSYRESFQDDNGVLHIVMGYCDGGDLCSRLKRCSGQLLPEVQVVEWFVQIALALQYLHERNILHRDLKTQNIFLSKNNIVKVGDLGIARVLDASTELAHTVIGTPYYMSPEQFAGTPYNHKSDIWALGCCLYEMASLHHAFTASNITSLMYRILHGEVPPLPDHEYSDDLSSLVQSMLSRDAAQRPSVHQILRLAYIKRHIRVFLDRERSKGKKSVATVAKQAVSSPALMAKPVDPPSQQKQQQHGASLSSARERRRKTRQHDSPSIGARIVLRSRSNEKLPSAMALDKPDYHQQQQQQADEEVISLLDNTLQLADHSPPLTHHDGGGTHDHTFRLRERNKYLKQELVSVLGEAQLHEAMAILANNDHDQHEDKLKQLIGQDGCQQCIGQLRELQLYNYLF